MNEYSLFKLLSRRVNHVMKIKSFYFNQFLLHEPLTFYSYIKKAILVRILSKCQLLNDLDKYMEGKKF